MCLFVFKIAWRTTRQQRKEKSNITRMVFISISAFAASSLRVAIDDKHCWHKVLRAVCERVLSEHHRVDVRCNRALMACVKLIDISLMNWGIYQQHEWRTTTTRIYWLKLADEHNQKLKLIIAIIPVLYQFECPRQHRRQMQHIHTRTRRTWHTSHLSYVQTLHRYFNYLSDRCCVLLMLAGNSCEFE